MVGETREQQGRPGSSPGGPPESPVPVGAAARPAVTLPKGGGAIRGIGEKFAANPVMGTGTITVPIATSPARSGFGPQLALSYDSGAGNGPFGFGWSLSLPAITRKTDKGLPQYRDAAESDVYVFAGAEDLVPVLRPDGTRCEDGTTAPGYVIHRYRPRVEGLFARIERWTNVTTGDIHWRSISRDNVTSLYGTDGSSRLSGASPSCPGDAPRIFSWLICESYDDKGNAIIYEWAAENADNVDLGLSSERNRVRTAGRYLKRIRYGNRQANRDPDTWMPADPVQLPADTWMFEVVFDYEEAHCEEIDLSPAIPEARKHEYVLASPFPGSGWALRPDPFSSCRAGFEVRTYRRCRRVLMFHHIPALPTGEEGYDGLVRSTEFDYADLDYSQPVAIEAELAYQGSTRFASLIRAVTQSGYVRDDSQPVVIRGGVRYATYLRKSLPPLEFEYSRAAIQDQVRELDAASLDNLPEGVDGSGYRWADLDGEGLSGILTEQGGAWYYKANLGDGHFGPLRPVAAKPSMAGLRSGRQQLLDLAGDGQLDLVTLTGPTPGFYERTFDGNWAPFRTFSQLPNIAWDDPNLRFADLDGDGHADVLITEQDALTWHASLAEDGFGPARTVRQPSDEEHGPRLILADGTQSIYLADMCGDGLTDLVRIRNGEVCYWPNLGYGRFGPKVTMDNAPWFDDADRFDQRRVRLADIDGSGTIDIIYLASDGVRLYFNQSGNRLSEPRRLAGFPQLDNNAAVAAVDLLGNGTTCLVWSSPRPADARRPMRYIDLMGGNKPHLLVKWLNNLGAETQICYAPSTRFYLQDKRQGQPWVTRLPFPVHVVERVVTYDHISGNQFVTRYAYHHGYFDAAEREFRGFALVEQWDAEDFAALHARGKAPARTNIEASSHVPPVLTRTWFHTGVYVGRDHVSDFFAGVLSANKAREYYREPGLADVEACVLLLDDTVLPDGLTADEEREACRALKGSMLRQEVYALDGTGTEQYPNGHPYTVTEQNFTIRLLQPRGANRHAVFFTHPCESLSYHYERDAADPRVSHALTLAVDDYGNVLKSAAVGYGRREETRVVDNHGDMRKVLNPSLHELDPLEQVKQTQVLVTYTENGFTNAVDQDNDYRAPMPSESRIYELTGLPRQAYEPAGLPPRDDRDRFTVDGILQATTTANPLEYQMAPTAGQLEKRLIEHARIYYRRDDLAGPLPLGMLQPLALPFESYRLAFTPGLVVQVFDGRVSDAMLDGTGAIPGGCYVHMEGDANWWIPSGQIFYSPGTGDAAPDELAYARKHFFLPHRYRNPFHTDAVSTENFVAYDCYDLLIHETTDALGNQVTAGHRRWVLRDDTVLPETRRNDYRVLQPALVMDPNRNRSEVTFDALGMVVGTAVMGKPAPAAAEGDSLSGFRADLTQAEMDQFLANPKGPIAATLLGDATTRVVYDLAAYWREANQAAKPPAVAATLARETHASDPVPAGGLRIQVSLSYSDGFGREIQKKIQAEPGPVPVRAYGKIAVGADGQPLMTPDDVSPRWVGSGWTVFNNKGKPVRQYEPFFDETPRFRFDVRIGSSRVLFYDPIERVVATLHPNHTWEKVLFGPWRQETWDANDTILLDPAADADVGDFFSRLPNADYLPTWFALRTDAAHAAVFAAQYPDSLDRMSETRAAEKTRVHAATPTTAHADSLGRAVLAVAHNKVSYSGRPPAAVPVEEFYSTRIGLDIEGNQREVRDALTKTVDALGSETADEHGRAVARYDYDMLGNRIHQASMDAGERWMFNDVAGKPLFAWDAGGHSFRTDYDPLRRPTDSFLRQGAGAELLTGRNIYGETRPNAEAANLLGKVVQVFDQAGVLASDEYDFKGNLLHSERQLAELVDPQGAAVPAYKTTVDWSGTVQLETDRYTSRTHYDAVSRRTQSIAPHSIQPGAPINVIEFVYNEASLLDQIHAWLNQAAEPIGWLEPATATVHAVTDIDYDAKGQRIRVDHGNQVTTVYEYDALTFRLARLLTRRDSTRFPDDCPQPPSAGWPGCDVQNLHYTYDPVGNITNIRDDAQQTIYFRNKRVEPSAGYTYDAVYRLIEATGREHLGQTGGVPNAPIPHSYNDVPRVGLLHPNDGNATGRYLERYVYDAVGNFRVLQHHGSDPAHAGWRRTYTYNETSQLEPGKQGNRLTSTTVDGTTEAYSITGDGYDAHGNMLHMPQLQVMQWDFKDQLQMTQRQAVSAADADGALHQRERTWYVYDSSGQRVRKITESATGLLKNERIYLGAFEICRRNGANPMVQEMLHIVDDTRPVALVETRTQGNEPDMPAQLVRYQFTNHLGSASLELDDKAQIISYEEYTPYGSTAYQTVRSKTETPKRYRFTGKERDENSGLYYHGARYYAPWLGRWTSCDPEGLADGANPLVYVACNPVRLIDPKGRQSTGQGVISLGVWAQLGRWTGIWPSSVPPSGPGLPSRIARTFLIGDAERNTGLAARLLTKIPGWGITWASLGDFEGLPTGKYSGLASGVGVQQVFQEGVAAAIHIDVTGVEVLGPGQTPSELRNIITNLQTGANQNVDVHIYEKGQLSTIPAGSSRVVGAPLPERIAERLPNIEPPAVPAPPSTPTTSGPATAPGGSPFASGIVRAAGGALRTAASTGRALGRAALQTGKSLVPFSDIYDYVKYGVGAGSLAQGARIGGQQVVKALSKKIVGSAGAEASVTGAAVLGAAGAVTWAVTDIRRALRGETTLTEEAESFWKKEGFVGGLRQFWREIKSIW